MNSYKYIDALWNLSQSNEKPRPPSHLTHHCSEVFVSNRGYVEENAHGTHSIQSPAFRIYKKTHSRLMDTGVFRVTSFVNGFPNSCAKQSHLPNWGFRDAPCGRIYVAENSGTVPLINILVQRDTSCWNWQCQK